MSIFIADTSSLVAFSAVHLLDALRVVAPDLRVPPSVYKEIVTDGEGWREAMDIKACLEKGGWPALQIPMPCALLDRLRERLGAGEAEAMALGRELKARVIVDDGDARRTAAKHALDVIGTLGILSECKRKGLLPLLAPVIQAMRDAGIRFGESLVQEFLQRHGE